MLTTCFDEALREVVEEVLESMCFLFLDDPAAAEPAAGTPALTRQLSFTGPFQGSFGIETSLGTAALLACNVLGQEPEELSPELVGESLGEIANMVCGAVLCRIENTHTFQLSSPSANLESVAANATVERTTNTFCVEGGTLHVWIEIHNIP